CFTTCYDKRAHQNFDTPSFAVLTMTPDACAIAPASGATGKSASCGRSLGGFATTPSDFKSFHPHFDAVAVLGQVNRIKISYLIIKRLRRAGTTEVYPHNLMRLRCWGGEGWGFGKKR
ncbi:MAG: hypothetical protein NC187_08575, partial [Candidatus Amulumruptor caecigallinarius]|nr:hypothetical protein [Candidatus Amulumruptor caecigallinarius]MCM1397522.1 hypothetical protein [Candidatus Amulumruptor caecigallinarius]MCM1454424.1 hypothetical protein [bacterium]